MSIDKKKKAGIRFNENLYINFVYDPDSNTVNVYKNDVLITGDGGGVTPEELMQILEAYVQKSELVTALADYVLDSELATTLANYVSDSELASTLADYVSDSELASTLADYVLDSELANYVSDSELNTALANYVSNSELATTLADYVSDSELATILADYVSDSELATILADYVSDSELATTLANYATSGELRIVEQKIPDLTPVKITHSISKTNGNDLDNTNTAFYKSGSIVNATIVVNASTTVIASGNNIFTGKLNTTELLPITRGRLIGYYDEKVVIANINSDGSITIRNSNQVSITVYSPLVLSGVYMSN